MEMAVSFGIARPCSAGSRDKTRLPSTLYEATFAEAGAKGFQMSIAIESPITRVQQDTDQSNAARDSIIQLEDRWS